MQTVLSARICTFVFVMIARAVMAQTSLEQTSIAINVDNQSKPVLAIRDLEQLTSRTVSWNHNNTQHEFTAVPLEKIAEKYGITSGPKNDDTPKSEKRSGYKYVIVASANDGYQAVISFAEIASTNSSPSKVFLAWEDHGKPIEKEGPFRLVAVTDGEGARSIHNIQQIDFVDLRKIVKPRVGN